MIYVHYSEALNQVLFTPKEDVGQGVLLGTLDKLPASNLAFVAHALLRKNKLHAVHGISVVVAENAA